MKYQIITTTDGQFVGKVFTEFQQVVLNGAEFEPDKIVPLGDGVYRVSNSNYVIDVKEVE